jgi:hypothetical protein
MVGLSPAALSRDLVQSPAGQGLVAAGRLSVIGDELASMQPQFTPVIAAMRFPSAQVTVRWFGSAHGQQAMRAAAVQREHSRGDP